jgi:hypothetical protein
MIVETAMGDYMAVVPLESCNFSQAVALFLRFANKKKPNLVGQLLKSLEKKDVATPREFFERIGFIQLDELADHPLYQRIDTQELNGVFKFRYRRPLQRQKSHIDIELFSEPLQLVFTSKVKAYVTKFALEAAQHFKLN